MLRLGDMIFAAAPFAILLVLEGWRWWIFA